MTVYASKAKAQAAADKKTTGYSKTYVHGMSIVKLADGNLMARWKFGEKDSKTGKVATLPHLDHFNIDWEYYDTKAGRWVQGNNGVKQVPASSKVGDYYQDTFNLPSSAYTNLFRYRVRAVSQSRSLSFEYYATSTKTTSTTNSKGTKNTSSTTRSVKTLSVSAPYWTVSATSYMSYSFNVSSRPAVPSAPRVEPVLGGTWNRQLAGVTVTWDGFERPTTCKIVYRFDDYMRPDLGRLVAPPPGSNHDGVFKRQDGASYTDRTVEPGHVYWYAMRAHNYLADKQGADHAYSLPFDEMYEEGQFEQCLAGPVYSEPKQVEEVYAETMSVADGKADILVTWRDEGMSGAGYEVRYATDIEMLVRDGGYDAYTPDLEFKGDGYTQECVLRGLDAGEAYHIRVVVKGNDGLLDSESKRVATVVAGAVPDPPTPHLGDRSFVQGDEATVWWEHNASDNSAQEAAEVELSYTGALSKTETISRSSEDFALIALENVPGGTEVEARVRTKGAHPGWSEWSEPVSFSVYSKPACDVELFEASDRGRRVYAGGSLTKLPLACALVPAASTGQSAVEWSLEIVAANDFTYYGPDGGMSLMRAGSPVSAARVTASDADFSAARQLVYVAAGDGVFMNGAEYEVRASVLMDSGLRSDEATCRFVCSFDYDMPDPTASAVFVPADFSMRVLPECRDADGGLMEGVTVSVYRVGPGGESVPVSEGGANGSAVVDPHPSFGECSYRIVANDPETDQNSLFTTEPVPVPVHGILVQWDQDGVPSVDPDSGSYAYVDEYVFLGMDVTVEETAEPDRELVQVIGRESPMAFGGTQLGIGGTWSCNLHKRYDADVIAQLRNLQRWNGPVYARETSGAGYKAVATVRFSRSYDSDKVPVTIELVKVD